MSDALERSNDTSPPARRLSVDEIAALPVSEAVWRLDADRRKKSLRLIDYLVSPKSRQPLAVIIEELCQQMIAADLPLDRYGSSTTMVTAEFDAVGRVWSRDRGVQESYYVSPDTEEEDPAYLASPFREAAETGRWVEVFIPETPDERFGVIAEFRAMGLVHYICIPIWLTNEANGWLTFATKRPTGFDEQDLLTIQALVPLMTMRVDARVGWQSLDRFLRTYVGNEPHEAILAGRAKRGQVTVITAAMLVADLRDSTGHIASLDAVGAVDLFNHLFDCLVPPIELRQGEVLKYLGDGLLAIFRETPGLPPAAERALESAEAAFAAVTAWNAAHGERRSLEIGIALHYGEVAYGNIGSGSRLDFTVIGRDVALASRIAGMNRPLGLPLLMSAALAGRLDRPARRAGAFPARGFKELVEVFEPEFPQP